MTDATRREAAIRWFLLLTVPGILCTVLGPLGTYEVPILQRGLFWIPTMAFGASVGGALSKAAERFPPLAGRTALRFVVVSLLVTLLMTVVVTTVGNIVFGSGAARISPTLVLYGGIITATMSLVGFLAFERHRRVEEASAPAVPLTAPQHPALSNRLPPQLRDHPILALQAEDHYVRVHTAAGSDLVLMRLTDAAAEMAPVTGARTHRSWWVNRSAVGSVLRRNGATALVLANGLEVPVGRSYAGELREAGWLSG